MNQRSEHLSDAQIEQYGKRASGAGPEAAAQVETHLDDCPSCRSRVLEFQRTQFALFPDPKVNTVSSSNCPSEEDLRNLAAGLSSDPRAAELTAHAATCSHCGPLLREYQEDFSDDVTPEEQTALAQLRSSSPKWQRQKAREMLQPIPKPVPRPIPPWTFTWRWALIPTAACVLLALGIGGVTWYARRDTPEKVEVLLAQASTERRNLEMRLPYAAFADFDQKRSGEEGSRTDSPESLNEANTLISKHLKKDPDDPTWLMLSARLDLLDWRYKPAFSKLEKITNPQIVESPEFLMTRALALYEKSEMSKRSEGYDEALDILDIALQKRPNDPVLLFNRGIVCEKTYSRGCAKSSWERLLAVEKDPQWRAEADRHLKLIDEKKNLAH